MPQRRQIWFEDLSARAEVPLHARRILITILCAGLALRAVWAVTVPLLDGETYYWLWSKTPALSYLDHPPFIAYLIRLTTLLGDHHVWVRTGPLLAGVLTPLALFMLGSEMFGARAGLIAAGVYQLVPVLAGGGLFATPEAPFFLWWSLALLCVRRALWVGPRWWVPAGMAIGLGMLSKLTMIVLPVGILGYVLTRRRDALRQPWTHLGAAAAVALTTPVLIWNAGNGWAAVRWVLHERPQQVATGLAGLLAVTLEQLAFVGLLFPVLIWMLVPALRSKRDDRLAFLLWMSLPTLVVLALVVARSGGAHGHWAGPAYLGLAVVLGALWPGRLAALAMAASAVITVAFALTPLVPWLPVPLGAVESVAGWAQAARRAQALAASLPEPVVFAIPGVHFEGAAQLAYYTRRSRPVTIVPRPPGGSIFAAPTQYPGASIVWVVESQWHLPPPERIFCTVVAHGDLPILVRGREVRRFLFWTARGLQEEGDCPGGEPRRNSKSPQD